jgi:site-specific DNA-adenine methylase
MDDPAQRMAFYTRVRNNESKATVDRAFRYYFLNKTNFSGKVHSTPIGGWEQDGWQGKPRRNPLKEGVACQYHPKRFVSILRELNGLMNGRTEVRCCDALSLLKSLPPSTPAYLDPPYFPKTKNSHYREWMSYDNHVLLADQLRTRSNWVLSYEDSAAVREIYDWADLQSVDHIYSIGSIAEKRGGSKRELIIMQKIESEVEQPAPRVTPPPSSSKLLPAAAKADDLDIVPIRFEFYVAVNAQGSPIMGTAASTEEKTKQLAASKLNVNSYRFQKCAAVFK